CASTRLPLRTISPLPCCGATANQEKLEPRRQAPVHPFARPPRAAIATISSGQAGRMRSAFVVKNWCPPGVITALQLSLATTMLSWAAIYNHYPFVDFDTVTYVISGDTRRITWLRSPFYSYFVLFLGGGGRSLWPAVVVQSLIGAYLIRLALKVLLPRHGGPGWYLGIVLVLSAATGLPWVSGQIMPDIFAGYVALGVFLLGFGANRLSRQEAAIVFALTTLAIACHFTHVLLAIGLAMVSLVVKAAESWRAAVRPVQLARLGAPAAAAVGGLIA